MMDVNEWMPIETAPKDGTVILLAYKTQVVAGWWSDAKEARMSSGDLYPWCFVYDRPNFDEDASAEAGRGLIAPNGFQNDAPGPTHWSPMPLAPEDAP